MSSESELDDLTGELLDRYEEINLLYDIGGALAGVFDVDLIGRTVVDRAMAVTRATGGLFLLASPEGLAVTYRAGDVPDVLVARLARGGDLATRVLATPALVMQPLLAVRVQRDGEMFAAIALVDKRDDTAFTAGDARLLQTLAAQAAGAIHTERLVEELRRSERLRSELEVARRLQAALLPASAPRIPGLELVGACQPSGHVGGDYFDFFALPDGRLGMVIADVSGHGVSSAIVMAGLRSTLHAEIREGFSTARVLERANVVLGRDFGESGMFVSAFLAAYDPVTGMLDYTNAGHPPPFLLSRKDTEITRLDLAGVLLGIVEDATYESGIARLEPGGVLVLYTDGVTEARSPRGDFLGEAALARIVADGGARGAASLHAAILGAVRAHVGGGAPVDDVTLVVASRAA